MYIWTFIFCSSPFHLTLFNARNWHVIAMLLSFLIYFFQRNGLCTVHSLNFTVNAKGTKGHTALEQMESFAEHLFEMEITVE